MDTATPALVFDIGGTSIRVARVNPDTNRITCTESAATPNFITHGHLNAVRLVDAVIQEMRGLADRLLEGQRPSRLIVGYPGPVTDLGEALGAPTILGPEMDCRHDIAARLRVAWPDCEVLVVNDLTCAGYAYVAEGYEDFCVVTVGSGIGNKVFVRGHPLIGSQFRGGEIGHLRVASGPELSQTGKCEEIGSIASGRGSLRVARLWGQSNEFETSEQLAAAFLSGDDRARRIIHATCHPLALALGCIHLAIGVERFFIIGGFAKALGESYRSLLAAAAADTTWNMGQDWNRMIRLGVMGVEESLLGGAYLARRASMGMPRARRVEHAQ